jgi:acyl dehydratase
MELRGKYFEDWEIGTAYESASRTITETDIVLFAGLSGDYNPLHTDEEFAKKSVFGTRIPHGLLVLSISSGQINQSKMFEGTVEVMLALKEFRLTKPVMPGDTIRTRFQAIEKKVTSQGKGVVTLKMDILNQKDEVCSERVSVLMIKRRHD